MTKGTPSVRAVAPIHESLTGMRPSAVTQERPEASPLSGDGLVDGNGIQLQSGSQRRQATVAHGDGGRGQHARSERCDRDDRNGQFIW